MKPDVYTNEKTLGALSAIAKQCAAFTAEIMGRPQGDATDSEVLRKFSDNLRSHAAFLDAIAAMNLKHAPANENKA